MTSTLRTRFDKKFPRDHDVFVAGKLGTLAFIASELELLTEEVEGTLVTRSHDKSDKDRQDKGHNIGIVRAASIIREKIKEIKL